jgi:phosphate-selective porin OprO/OprP
MNNHRVLAVLLSLAALGGPRVAAAQGTATDPPESARTAPASKAGSDAPAPLAAEARMEELDQKVRIIERRWEVEQETQAARKEDERKNPASVAFAYGKDGAGIRSADGKFQFRLRPLLQADGRFYISENVNTFLLRRVRPVMEGTIFEFFDWRIMPELAGTPNVQDAYGNIRLIKEVQFRGGKFKGPVGLERLASDADLPFVERGLPTQLVPDRDVGFMLHGDLFDSTLAYAIGLFNGVGDGASGDLDNNDKKDWDGRLVVRPFQPTSIEALRGLGLGIAATRGTHTGPLPGYRTSGQATFFQYADGVTGTGTHRRLAPQAFYYYGPLGIFGEYVVSSQVVAGPTGHARVDHKAWQVVGSFFITGEDASYSTVTPKHQLDPKNGTIGAIEVVARYGEVHIDDGAFERQFADPNRSARRARAWAVGLNWHLARNFKLMADYERTNFEGGGRGGDRPHEIVVLTRLQAAY